MIQLEHGKNGNILISLDGYFGILNLQDQDILIEWLCKNKTILIKNSIEKY